MSRVLAYTSPARGHLFPVTPILTELRARGHEVLVCTLPSCVDLMTDLGLQARSIDPRVEALTMEDWCERTPRKMLARAVRTFRDRASYDAADLRSAIEEWAPDTVLVDINSWGALSVAEQWSGPWSAFCPYPLALRSPDVPPFGPGLAPARGLPGRVRDALLRPILLGTLERTMLPPLNSLRSTMGLPRLATFDDLYLGVPLLLYLTAEPFEYPRSEWPPNITMVGPGLWEPPAARPEWLSSVEQPVILVTTSSEHQDDARLVTAALEALADEPFQVVVTMPSGDPTGIEVPPNARIERFVPHGALLDRAVCVVTHGGMGATQKALARGVPVCAVPFGRDQAEVARRVEVAEAGTRLPAGRLRPDRLRAAVLEAVTCRPGAARVAAGFAAAGGPTAAADAVEQTLLGTSAARPPGGP